MCTYFLFLNIDYVKRVNESGLGITPHAYNDIHVQQNISPDFICKALGEKQKRLVSDVLKHKYDDNENYQFDTLQLYQLAAESLGYSVYKLTHLRGYTSRNMKRYFSDDIIHIGAASHFLDVSRTNQYPEHIIMLKLAYLLLCKYNTILPTSYKLALKLTRFKLLGMSQSVNLPKMEEDIGKYFIEKI